MHILILSKRNAQAQTRLLRAAEALGTRLDLDPALIDGLKVNTKDQTVRAMQEREAVAALLEELAYLAGALEKPAPAEEEAVTAVTEEETGEGEPVDETMPEAEPGDELPPPVIDEDAGTAELDAEPQLDAEGTPIENSPVEELADEIKELPAEEKTEPAAEEEAPIEEMPAPEIPEEQPIVEEIIEEEPEEEPAPKSKKSSRKSSKRK